MPNLDIPPLLLEVFGDQAPVTASWLMLTTQETCHIERRAIERLINTTFLQKIKKPTFVF